MLSHCALRGEIKPNTIPVLDHLAAMSVALNSDALEGIGEAARGELIEDGMLNVSDTRRAIPAVGMRDAPYSRPISIVFLYIAPDFLGHRFGVEEGVQRRSEAC